MIKFLKNKVLPLIYPPKCIFCNDIIASGSIICEKCCYEVRNQTMIRVVSEFLDSVVYCISPFKYDGSVREAICRFKFYGYKDYAEFFSEIIYGELLTSGFDLNFDIISAVPLSKIRMIERGYNQSECLGRVISKKFGIVYEETLMKTKNNFIQHELPRKEREENVKGVYAVRDQGMVENKNILICDDIITTGSTLKECVKVLKLSGAKNIVCCTVAYVS